MTELVMPGVSPAHVNHSRWIARCGWPDRCDGAATLSPFQPGFICGSCRNATDVVWPTVTMVESVTRLLTMRPHPKNRNWLPDETLGDLLTENAVHGILPLTELPLKAVVMATEGDRIKTDALPQAPTRLELMH